MTRSLPLPSHMRAVTQLSLLVAALTAVLLAIAPARADAKLVGMQSDNVTRAPDGAQRDQAFARMQGSGVQLVRTILSWSQVAAGCGAPYPSSPNSLANPDNPCYQWV